MRRWRGALLRICGLLVVGFSGAAATEEVGADPEVAAAQALLRGDRMFRGKVNGIPDLETEAAIRRFQITYGLRATGRLDEPTVATMRLPRFTPPPTTLDADRRFLREQTPASPPPVAEQTTAPTRAKPAEAVASHPAFGQGDLRSFLENFLEAAGEQNPGKELGFYADSVDYFKQPALNRESLAGALDRSRAAWPNRRFELLDLEPVTALGKRAFRVRFTLRFENSNGLQRKAGIERQEAVIVRADDGSFKLAALHLGGASQDSRQ
ncbi:MAG: peptidoglycan-binding domain-containing protein [Verrucomicrobiota bacterium]